MEAVAFVIMLISSAGICDQNGDIQPTACVMLVVSLLLLLICVKRTAPSHTDRWR